ncbi:tetratricopeptide repeat protein [Sphingomonas sp. M1-B02]|uniref:tetratricopeptide repeat protein n=1 Tax=Sphingomonas sp. M1-B02 TaxID=3114300 RepID=UPI00223F4D6D|nr:tetratricopeptide repeat protein [Sphingomonas sp. S6-11]UZK66544.1 tetratricopeptide repeat protein [Sphingomonas sp. S6-11]
MRITAISAAAALLLLSLSTSLSAQRPDAQIDPKSLALLQDGRTARAAGNIEAAQDALESALAVDPRNRDAFIVLAEISRQRDLPGKAIRLYREALALQPNDLAALRGQGEALVARGAVEKAKENLAKIKTLCPGQCNDANILTAAIAKGPPVTATAQAAPTTPAPATP